MHYNIFLPNDVYETLCELNAKIQVQADTSERKINVCRTRRMCAFVCVRVRVYNYVNFLAHVQ